MGGTKIKDGVRRKQDVVGKKVVLFPLNYHNHMSSICNTKRTKIGNLLI